MSDSVFKEFYEIEIITGDMHIIENVKRSISNEYFICSFMGSNIGRYYGSYKFIECII